MFSHQDRSPEEMLLPPQHPVPPPRCIIQNGETDTELQNIKWTCRLGNCKRLFSHFKGWWGGTSYAHAWSSPLDLSIPLMFDATAACALHENASTQAKWMLSRIPQSVSPPCGKAAGPCTFSLLHSGHWGGPAWTLCFWAPGFRLKQICTHREGHGTVTAHKRPCSSRRVSHIPTTSPSSFRRKLIGTRLAVHPHSRHPGVVLFLSHPCWNFNSLKGI